MTDQPIEEDPLVVVAWQTVKLGWTPDAGGPTVSFVGVRLRVGRTSVLNSGGEAEEWIDFVVPAGAVGGLTEALTTVNNAPPGSVTRHLGVVPDPPQD